MLKPKTLHKVALVTLFTTTILFFQNCKQSGEIAIYDEQSDAITTAQGVDENGNPLSENQTNNEQTSTPGETTTVLGTGTDNESDPEPTNGSTTTSPEPSTGTGTGTTTDPGTTTTTTPVPKTPEELISSCADAQQKGKITRIERQISFEDPAKECSWGQNGNLSILNSFMRAREEQMRQVEIPAGAKVCNLMLKNIEVQRFVYDDNIFITLNNIVLASTSNFTQHLTSQNGLYKYEWSRLINKDAQNAEADTAPDKQFCAGESLGQSSCTFPVTEQAGSVLLSFDKVIIQNVLGITSPTNITLGMITTGDNDKTDCQHVPLTFKVEMEYYE